MRVILLGDNDNRRCVQLKEYLLFRGESVLFYGDKIRIHIVQDFLPEIIVSYNYRFTIPNEIFTFPRFGAINLHISYLPWNRGADPNLWSFAQDTPKGVTIHYIDRGIDTGDIIVQKEISFSSTDTLRTSYDNLHDEIQSLFKENWDTIRIGQCARRKQDINQGSFHFSKDKECLKHLLTKGEGWDTPVSALRR